MRRRRGRASKSNRCTSSSGWRTGVHRRPHAEARHARRGAASSRALDREDARSGGRAPQHDVRGRKAELRPSFAPCTTRPLMRVGMAEQRARRARVARRERRAHRRARHALALELRRRPSLRRSKPWRSLRLAASRSRRRAARRSGNRRPTSSQRTPRPPTSTSSMKRSGGSAAKRASKRATYALDAGRGEQLELVAQPREARRRRVAGEEFARMRLERQHAGGAGSASRALAITRSSSAWWPRWTPSKLPIVSAHRPRARCKEPCVTTMDVG